MNLFRRLQDQGFAFTVFSTWDWNTKFDSELAMAGIDRWTVFQGQRPNQVIRLKEGPKAYGELIDKIGCDVAYVNTMNGMGFLWSEEASRRSVPSRIVHCHNSAFGSGAAVAKAIAHTAGRKVWGNSATYRIACSNDAGRYLFGNNAFEVIKNGIDTKSFAYSPKANTEVRRRYGIPQDAPLIGSVGRFAEAKNPLFQVRVFSEILKREGRAWFMMVGDGEMRPQIQELATRLGILDRLIMPGYTTNPSPIYSALDCFLMPSLYEGLAIVSIESQCAGCPIICSEALPDEAHVTDAEEMLPLSAGEAVWAEHALTHVNQQNIRAEYAKKVFDAGFDANATAERMATILGGIG
jgi:glycosyltransferase involved in cell wall biosynthesis